MMMPNQAVKRTNKSCKPRGVCTSLPEPLFAAYLQRNATRLRTALWRCDLGDELPLVAVLRPSRPDPWRTVDLS